MTRTGMHPLTRRLGRSPVAIIVAAALTLAGAGAGALTAGPASAARTSAAASAAQTAAPPYSCAANGPPGNQTIYGTFGDAGVIGWTGNSEAVTACLGGSFFTRHYRQRPRQRQHRGGHRHDLRLRHL